MVKFWIGYWNIYRIVNRQAQIERKICGVYHRELFHVGRWFCLISASASQTAGAKVNITLGIWLPYKLDARGFRLRDTWGFNGDMKSFYSKQ